MTERSKGKPRRGKEIDEEWQQLSRTISFNSSDSYTPLSFLDENFSCGFFYRQMVKLYSPKKSLKYGKFIFNLEASKPIALVKDGRLSISLYTYVPNSEFELYRLLF
jgi:hypothetical protein